MRNANNLFTCGCDISSICQVNCLKGTFRTSPNHICSGLKMYPRVSLRILTVHANFHGCFGLGLGNRAPSGIAYFACWEAREKKNCCFLSAAAQATIRIRISTICINQNIESQFCVHPMSLRFWIISIGGPPVQLPQQPVVQSNIDEMRFKSRFCSLVQLNGGSSFVFIQ